MSATPGFAFSCDSPDGCMAHAMVAGATVEDARQSLTAALHWFTSEHGDLCPNHIGQYPAPPSGVQE